MRRSIEAKLLREQIALLKLDLIAAQNRETHLYARIREVEGVLLQREIAGIKQIAIPPVRRDPVSTTEPMVHVGPDVTQYDEDKDAERIHTEEKSAAEAQRLLDEELDAMADELAEEVGGVERVAAAPGAGMPYGKWKEEHRA